jgi:hypothetical protein
VAMSAATRAKQSTLPRSATITVRNQEPHPCGEVEVTPHGGRIHFENKDKKEYRLRLWRSKSEPSAGIDILLPAAGRATVVIRRHDEFHYSVLHIDGEEVMTGKGGGPIKN